MCGSSQSNAGFEKSQNNIGLQDLWIIKTNSIGEIEWDKTIGSNVSEGPASIRSTKDGGYIVGGGISLNPDAINPQGQGDYLLIKLDGLGNVEWQKTYGGGTQSTLHGDNLHEIDLTRDGGYILAGTSYSPIGNEKSEDRISNALGDYWVVKVDGLGNIEWDEVYGGTGRDWLFSVQEIPGGYILGGMSQSDKGFDKSEDRFVGISGDRRYVYS